MVAARQIPGIRGLHNTDAALWCDGAIVAIPYGAMESLRELADPLAGKLVISILNPVKRSRKVREYPLSGLSAAESIASLLPRSAVATAFNNIPVTYFSRESEMEADVLVAADSHEVYERTAELVRCIPRLRPLYVGPLSLASSVERLTVLLLNAAALNGMSGLSVRLVS
jgi:NADPH-dependent F420 reductase